jgi:hypothetical protein
MKLEKILAENMLRFRTKNLSDALRKKLIEQTVTQTVPTQPGAPSNGYLITDEDAAQLGLDSSASLIKSLNKQINNSPIETDDARTDQSTAWRTELVNKFGQERYNQLLQSMARSTQKSSNNIKIWFNELTQESRLQFLTQFDMYITALKKRKQDDEYKVEFGKGKIQREKIIPQGAPTIPPIKLYIDLNSKDQFVDNQSAITPAIQAAIDQLVADVKANQVALAGTDASFKVTSLKIASSSSRFRNTGVAANLSWADLSRARANNVKQSLITQLTALGVAVPESVVELKGGTNGDGTSGPQPGIIDNGSGKMVQAALSTDGKYNNVISDPAEIKKVINSFPTTSPSAPNATKDMYEQYKFLLVECTLEATYEIKIPVADEIASRGYSMLITAYKRPGTIKFPDPGRIPKIEIFKSSKLKNKSTPPILSCPNL